MADVKEVKILKDGTMATPVVLADSVKNLDGTKFKDSVYTKSEIDSKVSEINTAVNSLIGWQEYFNSNVDSDTTVTLNDMPVGAIRFVHISIQTTSSTPAGTKISIIFPSQGKYYASLNMDNGSVFVGGAIILTVISKGGIETVLDNFMVYRIS